MTGKVSGESDGDAVASWPPRDLFGCPVPANKGKRGRPQHAPTAENLTKLILLYAAGFSDVDCAAAIGVTVPTMKTHYFSSPELQRMRRNARMVLEGECLARLDQQSREGKTSATEKLMKRLDKAALGPVLPAKPKKAKLGKKQQRAEDAKYAGIGEGGWDEFLTPKAGRAGAH